MGALLNELRKRRRSTLTCALDKCANIVVYGLLSSSFAERRFQELSLVLREDEGAAALAGLKVLHDGR